MPILLPTPEELASLTPMQREKARRAIWRIVREADTVAARELRRAKTLADFGERVREHARALEVYMHRDDAHIIDQRRKALLEAVR